VKGCRWSLFATPAAMPALADGGAELRNVNAGAFEVYDIANNQLTGAASLGAVGTNWQLGGFAADPPSGSMGSSGSTSQLVQAMAGFGGGAADASNYLRLASGHRRRGLRRFSRYHSRRSCHRLIEPEQTINSQAIADGSADVSGRRAHFLLRGLITTAVLPRSCPQICSFGGNP
jgi:hypothetical protein